MTPFEERISQSYQMLHSVRMESVTMHHSVKFCIDKCMDTEELYTLMRANNAPVKYKLQKDLEEKQCVQHCSTKWAHLIGLSVTDANEQTTGEVQAAAMAGMLR